MFFRTFGNRLRHAGMDFSNTIRSKLLPALAAFALFFVVSAAYFAPQFRGEALPQHDVIQYEGMAKDISDMRAATGEDPQWTGGMFGGMPAYLINVAYPAQLVKRTVGQVVKIIDTPAGFLFFAMVSMWLMLLIVDQPVGGHRRGAGLRAFDLLPADHRRGARHENVGAGLRSADDERRVDDPAG